MTIYIIQEESMGGTGWDMKAVCLSKEKAYELMREHHWNPHFHRITPWEVDE